MRHNPTLAEDMMWDKILKHRPKGYVFTRQKPIWSFIVDFYCAKLSLAIEIDWGIHLQTKQYDEERTCALSEQWVTVIRYRNNEVINDLDWVYRELLDIIRNFEKNKKL